MKSWISSRSPRERLLLVSAAVVAILVLLIQGILIPGNSAARSASDRNTLAAANLSEARTLAVALRAPEELSGLGFADLLVQLATDHGLTVVGQSQVDGVTEFNLASNNSASVLAWANDVVRQTNASLRTLLISRGGETGLRVSATFVEAAT